MIAAIQFLMPYSENEQENDGIAKRKGKKKMIIEQEKGLTCLCLLLNKFTFSFFNCSL